MYSYMTIHLQSPILTTAGLAGVLLSFPTTWAFYSLLLRIRYMGMLNFVALFVIVGIGVVRICCSHPFYVPPPTLSPALSGRHLRIH